MVSTYAFIRQGQLDDTYALAEKMMGHKHDLMHKAIGWMLREAGKRDVERLRLFVEKHRLEMPRTMLRYAIEKFSPEERKHFMRKGWRVKGWYRKVEGCQRSPPLLYLYLF